MSLQNLFGELALEKGQIIAGPITVGDFMYIGYKYPNGNYYIKRQHFLTKLWGYNYFEKDFLINWLDKNSLNYGEPK